MLGAFDEFVNHDIFVRGVGAGTGIADSCSCHRQAEVVNEGMVGTGASGDRFNDLRRAIYLLGSSDH